MRRPCFVFSRSQPVVASAVVRKVWKDWSSPVRMSMISNCSNLLLVLKMRIQLKPTRLSMNLWTSCKFAHVSAPSNSQLDFICSLIRACFPWLPPAVFLCPHTLEVGYNLALTYSPMLPETLEGEQVHTTHVSLKEFESNLVASEDTASWSFLRIWKWQLVDQVHSPVTRLLSSSGNGDPKVTYLNVRRIDHLLIVQSIGTMNVAQNIEIPTPLQSSTQ